MDEFHIRSEAEYADALQRFPYPLEIVHGSDALATYERLKSRGDGSPIILGGASELAMVFETFEPGFEQEPSVQIILDRARELSFPGSLQ